MDPLFVFQDYRNDELNYFCTLPYKRWGAYFRKRLSNWVNNWIVLHYIGFYTNLFFSHTMAWIPPPLVHDGSILPLYGRGKVVYEHVLGTTQAMRESSKLLHCAFPHCLCCSQNMLYWRGRGGWHFWGCVETDVPTSLTSHTWVNRRQSTRPIAIQLDSTISLYWPSVWPKFWPQG